MIKKTKKYIFLVLGLLSLALGVAGIPLPILPTTPFILLSAYFFSRGSTRLHKWLLNQKTFGPIVSDWEKYGVINLKTKTIATVLLISLFTYTLIFVNVLPVIKLIVSLSGIGVLTFIWTRPSKK